MRTRDDSGKDQVRALSRITGAFMLRSLLTVTAVTGGDIMQAVIYAAIVQANIQPLNDDVELSRLYASLDTPPPDELRRPISVHALAGSLGMPYETTRRAVERLIAGGLVRRVSRSGVLASAAALDSPAWRQVLEQNQADAARMVSQLRRHGIELDG